jgi:adenylate cyclase
MAEERLQRRLAAILSADVVGYSRLMGLDEAGTLSRLNALRRELIDPAIAAHSGRIVKLMGDGALVEFASAVDAVTCAIEIQRQLREHDTGGSEADPIRFRIGINVGDIIIEDDDILRRRRQHRGADRGHRRTRRHLDFRGYVAAGAGQGGGQLRR